MSRPAFPLIAIVLAGCLVRLVFLATNIDDNWNDFFQDTGKLLAKWRRPDAQFLEVIGFEASTIAVALVERGRGFADPFGGETGPTAWIAPAIVAYYALAFKLFGSFTFPAILALFLGALAVSVALILLVWWIGWQVSGRRRVGLMAAALVALGPYDCYIFRISSTLEFNLQTMALACAVAVLLFYACRTSRWRAVLVGITAGALALVNPVFLGGVFAGFAVLLARRRASVPHGALAVLVAGLVLAPWMLHVRHTLGGWVPVKSNAPFEIYLGNLDDVRGLLRPDSFRGHHPSQDIQEYGRYRELGELAYVRSKFREFRSSMTSSSFLSNSWRRFAAYFFGYDIKPWDSSRAKIVLKTLFWVLPGLTLVLFPFVLRRRLTWKHAILCIQIGLFSLPFMVTGVMERYRLPMIPLILVLLAEILDLGAGSLGRRWLGPRSKRSTANSEMRA